MIYFIKAGNFIRVGYTKSKSSFKTRLATYNTSCPYEVEVLNLIEGGVNLEKDILNFFLKFHIKGEWLIYDKSIEDFAKSPFPVPVSKIKKPTNSSHRIISNNLNSIIDEYKQGNSLRVLSEKYNVNRSRLSQYIPEDLKRKKNGWFSLRKQQTNPKNKKVLCVDTGEQFYSIKDASRKTGICATSISKVCKGFRKKAGNLSFLFVK